MSKEYYQTLGVGKDANQEEIKAAYRRLAFQHHPDRNKEDPTAAEKMKEINEAYAVLSDREKREKYDAYQASYGSFASQRFRESYSEEDIFRDSDINQVFEEMAKAFGFRNFDEIFSEFYGSRYRTFSFRGPGGGVGRGFISFRGFGPHLRQRGGFQGQGQGQGPPLPLHPFASLLNRFFMGRLEKASGVKFPKRGRDLDDVLTLSPAQAQKGDKIKYPYQKWGGPQKIMVKVPPGIKDGQRIRLKGLGSQGKDGGKAGDLYLRIRIRVPVLQRIKRFFGKS